MGDLVFTGALADWIQLGLILIGIGGIAGFLAGLLGVGGGIVLVPGLYYSLTALGYSTDVVMHMAVGTSLAIIVPTGFSSARAHHQRGAVDMDLVRRIGIGVVAGVAMGTCIAGFISGTALKGVFAVAIMMMAFIMLLDPARHRLSDHVPGQPWAAGAGGIIGGLSTLIGIGGATLSVPFMSMCNVAMHKAVGTASALGLVISIPATLGFILIGWDVAGRPPLSLGYVNFAAWAIIIPVSILAAPWGVHVAHKVSVGRLRRIFAVFMFLVAGRMLWGIFDG